jgi:hypothetical protein
MSVLAKILTTAAGIAVYEIALRPLVASTRTPAQSEPGEREADPDDDLLSEDWNEED